MRAASSPDWGHPDIRLQWAAALPFVVVCAFCLTIIPIPLPAIFRTRIEAVKAQFRPFLSLHEAESLAQLDDLNEESMVANDAPLWRTIVFAFLGLVQMMGWIATGSYFLVLSNGMYGMEAVTIGLVWLYAVARPITRPQSIPMYDVFVFYLAHLCGASLLFVGALCDVLIAEEADKGFYTRLALLTGNLFVTVILVATVLAMPIALPSTAVKSSDIGTSISPEDYTTLFGWITFRWVYPLVKKGRSQTLNDNDVWELSLTLQSRPVFNKFNTIRNPTLLGKLWMANSFDILFDIILSAVSVCFNYSAPFFMSIILSSIDGPDKTSGDYARAYIASLSMFVCSVAKTESDLQHLWFGRRAATHIRSELMASIYDKALKRKDYSGIIDKDKVDMSKKAKSQEEPKSKKQKKKAKMGALPKLDDPRPGAGVGKIVNLMSGDANKIANTVSGAYYLYGAPIELIVGGIFLYQLLGLSAFAGFLVLIPGWPLNSYLSRRGVRIQKGSLVARDKRMSVVNELIAAIKFIKFFAWEEKWMKRTEKARKVEIAWMIKARINTILFHVLWKSAPILISIVSFFTYVVIAKGELTISKAFTAISLFSMIRQPLNTIPTWILNILQSGVALRRIEVFFGEDEVEQGGDASDVDGRLGLKDATLHWNEVQDSADELPANDSASTTSAERSFQLDNISVTFPMGKISVIMGPTASGKTALLMALLGEMTLNEGEIYTPKASSLNQPVISYAAQTPWLQHLSIRDNILFGYPYNEDRYNAVLDACALRPDLQRFEDGHDTEIGIRGITLSGGQKARVALARAVYAPTKYLLLDDPLSAVDSHTARHLYEQVLMGPLLAGRTVVLVTHHVSLVLPGASYLVRMLDGRIDTQGVVSELRARGVLDDIVVSEAVAEDAVAESDETIELVVAREENEADEEETPVVNGIKKARKLVKEEHRETGGVKWDIYKSYLNASSYFTWVMLLSLVLSNQGLGIVEKLWIKTWGEAYQEQIQSSQRIAPWYSHPQHDQERLLRGLSVQYSLNLPDAHTNPLFYVGVYALIGLITAFVGVLSAAVQYTGALRASRILFKQLLGSVVHATFRFHDTTPQGRMLNRFGKDIEKIDGSLANSMQNVNSSLATFFISMLTVAFVFPAFLIPASVLGFAYRSLALAYLNTGRDLRRMESTSRSPIFSAFGEMLEGIVTVRAFSSQKRFLDGMHGKVDGTTKMWYNFWMTNRWLLVNFDLLGATGVLLTCLFSIGTLKNNAGLAGLCISSALSFTNSVYWACRFWTALELDLNSVERVVEYLNLPQEPPAIIESNRTPAYWPSRSDSMISVENLVVKYSPELPSVLNGISFTLRAGERVGLLGRTGSGKSTLAMSILRFVDPIAGRIVIDGIDISNIGVHDLRSRLTFIPQDATLFSGTVRENLDPFGEHDDSECWDVLNRVHMISSSPQGQSRASTPEEPRTPIEGRSESVITTAESSMTITLDTQVSTGGMNFSHGQRQLLAMARALLRRSSIIVLDEATSSIDFATDAKIQRTIREQFTDSLLLTVAHRLKTVIDYDRLIVMDKGKIAEFDTPANLIQQENGIFRSMCLKSGSFTELEAATKTKTAWAADFGIEATVADSVKHRLPI